LPIRNENSFMSSPPQHANMLAHEVEVQVFVWKKRSLVESGELNDQTQQGHGAYGQTLVSSPRNDGGKDQLEKSPLP